MNRPRPGIGEHPDLFPLLADQRGDVERSTAVEIGDDHVDRAGQFLEDVNRIAPVAAILEPQRLPLVVTERRDREILIAVAVEIAAADVGDAGEPLGGGVPHEAAAAGVLEDDHRSDPLVAGEELAEVGDEQVEVAVAVVVDRLDMARRANVGDHLLRVHALRRLPEPGELPASRIADEHVGQAVRVEIDDRDVRDLRLLPGGRSIADRRRLPEVRWSARGQDRAAFQCHIESVRPGAEVRTTRPRTQRSKATTETRNPKDRTFVFRFSCFRVSVRCLVLTSRLGVRTPQSD